MYTKSEMPSFTHTKDDWGAYNLKIGHVALTTPFCGWFVICWLGLGRINLPKDKKGDARYRKRGGLGVDWGHSTLLSMLLPNRHALPQFMVALLASVMH